MRAFHHWSEANKYTLYGALFGFCFPIGSVAFLYVMGKLPEAQGLLQAFLHAHRVELLYVIDSAPFFLGLFARFAGLRQDRILRFSHSLEADVAEKTQSLREALEEAKRANETIAHMAEHDPLTGLLNRRRLEQELRHWTNHALRYHRSIALVFIDLDNFKYINDQYGHAIGDDYLLAVTDVLQKCLRSTDYIARWGGDEFAVLLTETDTDAARDVGQKLLQQLNARMLDIKGERLSISASIGISLMPAHTQNANELLAFADSAMYYAKGHGRNRWHMYSASEQETDHTQEQGRWEARLRRALETDQFVLLYQPVVAVPTLATANYEALIRMEDRDGRLIGAGMFLAHAEQFNLSGAIDRMVVRKALRRIESLGDLASDLWLSINLSRPSLHDARFIDYVADMLHQTKTAPSRIGFEIAERAALEDMRSAVSLTAGLKRLGCRVVLDDFGMAMASFRHLRKLSVDMIKFDATLTRQIAQPDEQRIVRTLAAIARDMNVLTVAKFVEDERLLDMIRALGLDFVQGFAFGRPLESIEQAAIASAGSFSNI